MKIFKRKARAGHIGRLEDKLPEGMPCPILKLCENEGVDCFYGKFLHCGEVKKHYHLLNQVDKFNLRYKEFRNQLGVGS